MYALRRTVNYPDPFREMERVFFGRPLGGIFTENGLMDYPTDISDKGDHYLLRTDLPGFCKEEIRLELQEELLTIYAEHSAEAEEKEERYLRRERRYSNYAKSYRLKDIDTEKISAKFENGVLTLTLPKLEEVKPVTRQLVIE